METMRLRMLALLAVLAVTVAATGCSSSGSGSGSGTTSSTGSASSSSSSSSTPTAEELATKTAAAVNGQTSAHYAVNATFTVKTSGASSSSSSGSVIPGLNPAALGSKPIKLTVEGDVATGPKQQITAATAKGSASVGGQTFDFQLLASQSQLYVNLLGVWYGSKTSGIKSVTKQVGGAAGVNPSTTSPGKVSAGFAQAYNATVSDGPTLDGVATWELTGTLSPDGLAKLAQQQGTSGKLTQAQIDQLKAIAPAFKIVVAVGKDDSLPRQLHVTVNLTKGMLESLAKSAQGQSLSGLTSLDADVTVNFSNWGEKVTITPPASFQPLAKLFGALLGGSLGGTTTTTP
jgi:hypothetical protein